MTRALRGSLLLVVTFAAGVFAGSRYERRRQPLQHEPASYAQHVVARLDHSIGLDSVQRRAITEILVRHQGSVDSAWRAVGPHLRAALGAATSEIDSMLRPDQRAKFRDLVTAMHGAPRHD